MATAFSLDEFAAAPLLERAHAVSAGLHAKAVRDLVADPAITLADVARIVGPRRTIDRRLKENKPLPPEPHGSFARFVTVLAAATDIIRRSLAAQQGAGAPKRRLTEQNSAG